MAARIGGRDRRDRRRRIKRFLAFGRARLWAFGAVLGLVYALAFAGSGFAIFIPLLGGPLFLAGLMVWYVPGVLFAWTGFFRYHEFGAEPTGWQGHAVMLAFYACLALLASWPFAPKRGAE